MEQKSFDKNSPEDWENILKNEGIPKEISSEEEKAAIAGVELVSLDVASPEAEVLTRKLQEEDPRNIF